MDNRICGQDKVRSKKEDINMNRKKSILKQLQKIEGLVKTFKNEVRTNQTTNDTEVLDNLFKVYDNLYDTLVKNLDIKL